MASADDYAAWIVQNADKKGTPEFDIVAKAYQDSLKTPEPQGSKNNDLASMAGLGLRATIKAGATLPAMLADAVGGVANTVLDLYDDARSPAMSELVVGKQRGYRFQQQLPALDRLLTQAGLPQPDTPAQRIASQGLESGLGALSGAGLANQAGKLTSGAAQEVFKRLAADPGIQGVSGTAAGLAGQQSAENGGSWGAQMLSSLLGGVGGSLAARPAIGAVQAVENAFAPKAVPVDVEQRITMALQRQGIDPASITPALKKALMDDVTQSLKTGGTLNEEALARLTDYRRLGMTPTRGRLTLDPYDVTREQNAMRVAASTGARDAKLPQIAQGNNQTLLGAVDGFNPINDRVTLGERVIAPILGRDAGMKAQVDSLYERARDSSGRSAPLDGAAFAQQVNADLDKKLLGYAVPDSVQAKLNQIARGEVPFDVDFAEQLKTVLGDIARADKGGSTSKAMGVIRNALDNTPLRPAPQVNPGNLPAVPGTVPASPAVLGQGAIDAFNEARNAARQRFSWQDSNAAIRSAVDGAAPDNFLRDQIISRSASASDVSGLMRQLKQASPEAVGAVKSAVVQHLKEASIGRGNQTQTANFSGRQWLAALSDIGDAKLKAIFSADELEQLKAIGRTGNIETFQPRGSAVNNSNTAAGLANVVQGVGKYLTPFANKIPFGQAALSAPIDNLTISLMERGATNVPRGLLTTPPVKPKSALDALMLPGLLSVSP